MHAGSMLSSYRDLGECLVVCVAVEKHIIVFTHRVPR